MKIFVMAVQPSFTALRYSEPFSGPSRGDGFETLKAAGQDAPRTN
jgi:hypothetical protein